MIHSDIYTYLDVDVVFMSNDIIPILGEKEVVQINDLSFPYNFMLFQRLLPLFCEFFDFKIKVANKNF